LEIQKPSAMACDCNGENLRMIGRIDPCIDNFTECTPSSLPLSGWAVA
jgi:hypothetical protein